MSYILEGFDFSYFAKHYWQKKPCVIRNFAPDFIDPIDEHDLAGLAQLDEVDSRLVSFKDSKWQVTRGPIEDFTSLCVGDWSLLVQGVERYVKELDTLIEPVTGFGFWRMDDVMVSFSTPGAGVGAHIDQYDVFIVQGKGRRRWQVGLPAQHESFHPHPLLTQIEAFEAVIDVELNCGDAVYIPPLHPHNGQALSDCLNYSIGFRAPTNLEALNGLLDEGDILASEQMRYTDADTLELRRNKNASEVTHDELSRLKQKMTELLFSSQADIALMQYISRQYLPDRRPQCPYTVEEVLDSLQQTGILAWMEGVKPIYSEISQSSDKNDHADFMFFVDGQAYQIKASIKNALLAFIRDGKQHLPLTEPLLSDNVLDQYALLLTQLLNDGHVSLDN
uniref:cupin domain-containing protein n=1 Tax=Ningiella ruwaisensis TaxID=2364274 RepID=UPI001F4FEE07|nr:cupin domain-containing protein [Ningiella ruwaisensis]